MDTKMREETYNGYLYAIRAGMKQTGIAEASGIPIGSLRQYKATKKMGNRYVYVLREWLSANGYLDERIDATIDQMIARELRDLADVMDSVNLPPKFKADKFKAFINSFSEAFSVDVVDGEIAIKEEGN